MEMRESIRSIHGSWLWVLVLWVTLPPTTSLSAPPPAASAQASPALFAEPGLCSPLMQLQDPQGCGAVGPGHYVSLLANAGVTVPHPPLSITPTRPYLGLTPDAYAQIITDTAPVYRSPYEALAGWQPLRNFEKGFEYVSLQGETVVGGQTFYQINAGEFMRGSDLKVVRPSSFQGQFFSTPPQAPVGWLINTVQPSAAPGQPPDPNAAYVGRYQFFQVAGAERVGEWDWYLIGPGQWVEQRNVALTQPHPPPGSPDPVIAVDTYEQSMGVYQGGVLIFATLISSGSRYFPTRPGTFQVWARADEIKMSGAYFTDRSDYYFLEDVPWTMFYDGDRALHGAYWHDHFGIRGSHGCVNLSPRDARWLFGFASTGTTVIVFNSR